MPHRPSFTSSRHPQADRVIAHRYLTHQALTGDTKPSNHYASGRMKASQPHLGIIPLDGATLTVISILFSLIFIFTISFAFLGAEDIDEAYVKGVLDEIATADPGVSTISFSCLHTTFDRFPTDRIVWRERRRRYRRAFHYYPLVHSRMWAGICFTWVDWCAQE